MIREDAIKVVSVATLLLYLPCFLVALLMPLRPPEHRHISLDFTGSEASQVIVGLGTPCKPTLLEVSDSRCGIRLWQGTGRSMTQSASWIELGDTGGRGWDFLVAGGVREFLPMTVIGDAKSETNNPDVQGVIGVFCPEAWGIAPVFQMRCSQMLIGDRRFWDAGYACERDFAPFSENETWQWYSSGSSLIKGRRAAARCLPCARNEYYVVLVLVVVTVFAMAWLALLTVPSAGTRALGNAAAFCSACIFVAMIPAAPSSSYLWFFGAAILGPALATAVLNWRSPALCLGGRRMLVELPLLAAAWFAASCAMGNFFARFVVAGGAAAICAAVVTTSAISASLAGGSWIGWCVLAGCVNAAVMWITGLPEFATFLGSSVDMRLSAFGLFFATTGYGALLAGAGRVLALCGREEKK